MRSKVQISLLGEDEVGIVTRVFLIFQSNLLENNIICIIGPNGKGKISWGYISTICQQEENWPLEL